MNAEKIKIIKIMKKVLFILCFLGGLVIGFYPVSNQPIKLQVISENKESIICFSFDELQYASESQDELLISWDALDTTDFKEINIYRYFDSIVIAKINLSGMGRYGYYDDLGIHFYSEVIGKLYNYSKSFLYERMIFAEALVALGILCWIMLNAAMEKLDVNSRDNHGPIYEVGMFARNLKKYIQYIVYAAKADLKAEVANSYLNRLWWILEPFCNMLVYVIVFGHIMGNNIESYATFVFSALIMWNYFSHIINYSVKCVRNNRDIVTKIYVPKYILLLTNMVLNFIKMLFSLVVLLVMLLIFKIEIHWAILYIIPCYALMLLISFALGMIFLHYGVFIDDLAYAVGILLNMLMFLSGVFYEVITSLSEPLNQMLMCLNPVAMFIDSMRNALLYNRIVNVPLIVIWIILSLLIAYVGIHIVNKNENGYVKVI